jgi:hypothetical protein
MGISEQLVKLQRRHADEARTLAQQHADQRRNLHNRHTAELKALADSRIQTPLPRFPLTERR